MAWLCLPPYSPNLNLLERFWTFVKKPCLDAKYSADHLAFQQAFIECIEQAVSGDLKRLSTEPVEHGGQSRSVFFQPMLLLAMASRCFRLLFPTASARFAACHAVPWRSLP
jgi:hypothetical protein